MFFAVYFSANRLTTRLLPQIHWDRPMGLPLGSRRLNPLGFMPFANLGELVVLPDLKVEHHPWRKPAGIRTVGEYVRIRNTRSY